jgi:hypothetical protein
MRHIPLARIEAAALVRGPGYRENCLAAGTVQGDSLVMTEENYQQLVALYKDNAPVPQPSAAELLANFTVATARWVAQGMQIISRTAFTRRLETCRACRLPDNTPCWDETAHFGLGRCSRCRCSNLKLWSPAEKCPVQRW